MSTQLLLGAAGAAVGFFTGGIGFVSFGFLAGTLIGSLIDPPKSEGPQLEDLKLQTSSYGKMIPYVWGTGRIAGNVIDQTDLQKHKQTSGGKGGPQVTSYTYSASFDIQLCVGPILGIKRIWWNSKLVWADTTGEPLPCTVYLGGPSQTPDPTFEAIHGVGNVPGYNGYAHVVFADYFLTEGNNTIGQWEFEVYTHVGTFPWRVSAFDTVPDDVGGQNRRTVSYANGVVTIGLYDNTSFANGHYYERQFDIYGVEDIAAAFNATVTPSGFLGFPVSNLLAATDGSSWYVREQLAVVINAGAPFEVTGQNRAYTNGYIFAVGGNPGTGHAGVTRWPATNGVISTETATYDQAVDLGLADGSVGNPSLSGFVLGTTNRTDCVYVGKTNGATKTLFEYSFDLQTLNRQWDLSTVNAVEPVLNGFGFTVYETSQGDLILACDRGNVGVKNAGAFYLNANLSVTFIGKVDATNSIGLTIGNVAMLGTSPLALVDDGIISLIPPAVGCPLSVIVADISNLTPLGSGSPTEYNVAELTDIVRWYAVASVMTARNAISVLRPGFFFDARESNDVVEFKKLGGAPIFSIPDDSLCGRPYGEESGDPLKTIRTKEQGLPRTVTLTYYDVDADYQIGAQSSPRIVTLSEQDVVLDMPVGFTASEGLQKAEAIQASEWIRRERFEWSCTRGAPVRLLSGGNVPACALEPCDVGFVRGREIRIETRNESPGGVIKFTGVLSAPSIYTQSAPSGTGGFVPQQPPGSGGVATELVLLDIPILSQHDAPFGFYAAMGPATAGPWPGAVLFKSLDGGTTYNSVAASNVASVIGDTGVGPGSPAVGGVLAPYGGGNVVDESELCIVLTDDDAVLDSNTATAFANGAGLCAISRGYFGSPASTLQWELLQYRDATLVANRTYILKGFLRGRKNTLTSGHAVGDRFVLLPVTNVDAPESELNLSLKYKAVTFGATLASATVHDFINTGLSAIQFFQTEVENLPPFTGASSGSPSVAGTPGLVPAPPAGSCELDWFLSACGDFRAVPPPIISGQGIGANTWMFGLGGDGSAVLDGTNTVAWATKVGSVYTMTQIINMDDLQVDSGVTLMTRGFTIWVEDTLTNNGTISTAAALNIGGGANNAMYLPGADGPTGGIGNGAAGATYTGNASGGGGNGGAGGASPAPSTGGAGGIVPFPPGTAGFNPTATFGQYSNIYIPTHAQFFWRTGGAAVIGGGAGGGAGGGNNPQAGGFGGGGGGVLVIFARYIAGSGTFSVAGAAGGSPAGANTGGGGGGGGGLMYVITETIAYASTMTVSVAGGAGGAGNGTGSPGTAGATGRLFEFFV